MMRALFVWKNLPRFSREISWFLAVFLCHLLEPNIGMWYKADIFWKSPPVTHAFTHSTVGWGFPWTTQASPVVWPFSTITEDTVSKILGWIVPRDSNKPIKAFRLLLQVARFHHLDGLREPNMGKYVFSLYFHFKKWRHLMAHFVSNFCWHCKSSTGF